MTSTTAATYTLVILCLEIAVLQNCNLAFDSTDTTIKLWSTTSQTLTSHTNYVVGLTVLETNNLVSASSDYQNLEFHNRNINSSLNWSCKIYFCKNNFQKDKKVLNWSDYIGRIIFRITKILSKPFENY